MAETRKFHSIHFAGVLASYIGRLSPVVLQCVGLLLMLPWIVMAVWILNAQRTAPSARLPASPRGSTRFSPAMILKVKRRAAISDPGKTGHMLEFASTAPPLAQAEAAVVLSTALKHDPRGSATNVATPTRSHFRKTPPATSHAIKSDGLRAVVTEKMRMDAGTVRLKVLVKTGPKNAMRRQNVRRNWVDNCNLGQLHKKRNNAVHERYDFDQRLKAEKDDYFNIGGHVYPDGDRKLDVSCMFVTGRSSNESENVQLRREFAAKGDIMIGNFSDGYGIMTAKTVWTLMWSLDTLQYDYVMLIDDDATIIWKNFVPLVVAAKRRNLYTGHEHTYKGVKHCEDDTAGQMLKKNCVTWQQYNQPNYPPFASGFAYFMSRDVARVVVRSALLRLTTPGLPGNVEDAMVGVLAKDGGVDLTPSEQFIHYEHDSMQKKCRSNPPPAVFGNAEQYVLNALTDRGKNGRPLCI